MNQSIFIFGALIFALYAFFLFKIILSPDTNRMDKQPEYDVNDLDGMGNQGRFPDKKPKNRAV